MITEYAFFLLSPSFSVGVYFGFVFLILLLMCYSWRVCSCRFMAQTNEIALNNILIDLSTANSKSQLGFWPVVSLFTCPLVRRHPWHLFKLQLASFSKTHVAVVLMGGIKLGVLVWSSKDLWSILLCHAPRTNVRWVIVLIAKTSLENPTSFSSSGALYLSGKMCWDKVLAYGLQF